MKFLFLKYSNFYFTLSPNFFSNLKFLFSIFPNISVQFIFITPVLFLLQKILITIYHYFYLKILAFLKNFDKFLFTWQNCFICTCKNLLIIFWQRVFHQRLIFFLTQYYSNCFIFII